MTTEPDVIRLVDLYLRSPFYRKVRVSRTHFTMRDSDRTYPWEMIQAKPDAEGWVEWQPVDSPIDQEIVDGFERYLGVRLPSAFKSHLMHKCLIESDLRFSILPELDPRRPLGWLEWCAKASRRPEIRARPWYVPFTQSRAQMSVLCFDTQRPDPDGDYPIILTLDYGPSSDTPRPAYVEIHRSYRSYLRYLCEYLEYVVEGHDRAQGLARWMMKQGRAVPPELPYYQPG